MNKQREITKITLSGLLAGLIYTLLADDLSNPAPVINALLIGTVGGFFAGIIELYLFQPQFYRPEFVKSVFLKVITYFFMVMLVVLVVKIVVDSFFLNLSYSEYIKSDGFMYFLMGELKVILIYSSAMIFLIIFTMQVSKFLGRGVLWNIITGKYHSPRYENRVLLLIDLKGSTTIAEKLDPVLYYSLLDRFFFDVNAGSSKFGGEIYRYIGDQVTITWRKGTKQQNLNCIRAFYGIRHQIHQQREIYLDEFGFVPEFKGTAHSGQIVTGEIGDIRSQIVYYGAPLLEVAKLEQTAGRLPEGLCISQALLNTLQLPKAYSVNKITEVPFTSEKHLSAYEVREKLFNGQ